MKVLKKFQQHCLNNKILLVFRRNSIRVIHRREINTLDPISPNEAKFDKLLIANRGEIACRIINTAKEMGVKTVAVYSTVDSKSKHVKLADEAILIGGANASDSYLNTEKILKATQQSGAEAVHPGYGFLSENAQFAELLEANSLVFVGPSSTSIKRMGDKLESKRLAMEAGVNTIPGFDGIIKDADHCARIATDIGYPVMIKASAGGGGKGMRIARNDRDAREGFVLASEEARCNFADNRILLEKYIDKPRHIEIQVLGDKYGNVVHLAERECSIQRRHQKVIEEAPSTFLDDETRNNMGQQAVNLCKKIGYYSAGTVEFLVDQNRQFYFLEMNTRLQVEHPITESITGIDLVQQMLHIAKGHKLHIRQEDIKINGWAIETRVYAEDPYKKFGLPSVGILHKYQEPSNIRCDSGVEEGSKISVYYDPLIAKLICHEPTRQEAVGKCLEALDSYVIRGVTHNVPLLRDILTESRFNAGDINTNYLEEIYGGTFSVKELSAKEKINLTSVSAALYAHWEIRNRKYLNGTNSQSIAKQPTFWNLSIELLGKINKINIIDYNQQEITIESNSIISKIKNNFNLSQAIIHADIDGVVSVMQLVSKKPNGEFRIIYKGAVHQLKILPTMAADLYHEADIKPKVDHSKIISSPMPGVVKSVACQIGDDVSEGQVLCVIEAMKMQTPMTSATDGKVKTINIKEGDAVGEDDILVELI